MIEEIYTNALLAAAAYAEWDQSESVIKSKLFENGFTDAQYYTFFDTSNPNRLYEVIPNGYMEEPNGFSATIFRERVTGELTVAFRGSNSLTSWDGTKDWLTTNLDVVFQGWGVFGDLNTLFGQQNSFSEFLGSAGLDVDGVLTQPINFTGHSLGGFLSTLASYKYQSSMGQGYTFNGLGVDLRDYINNEILNSISLDGKLDNYYADLVGGVVGYHPGQKTEIFIEEEGLVGNHAIAKLVESFSVYRILAKLNSSLDSETGMNHIYSILEAASNVADQSLETIIDQLGGLLGGALALDTTKADVELFYQAIQLPENGDFGLVSITDYGNLADFAALDNEAGNGYRYALVNLLPFAITSNLAGTSAADVQYNLNDVNGDIVYTDQYLQDRSKFLSLIFIRNTEDITSVPTVILSNDGSAEIFTDIKTGQEIQTFDYSPVADRYIFGDGANNTSGMDGSGGDDHLYGMGGNDTLVGHGGNDYLEGGTGDDTITGGTGSDTLIGGAGKDTFIFNSGDGFDIIKGGDVGGDRILLNGDELGTLAIDPIPRLGEGTLFSDEEAMYLDEKGNIYIHDPYAETLRIVAAGSTNNFILLENYVPSATGVAPELRTDYGIQLPEQVSIESIPVGGFTDASTEGENSAFYPVFYYESDSSSPTHDFVYVSDFSNGNPEEWTSFGLISTFGGDDFIAVSANPYESNYAATELVGGKGYDTIYGAAGHDALFATEVDVPEGEPRRRKAA